MPFGKKLEQFYHFLCNFSDMNRKDLLSLVIQRGWMSIAGFGTILLLPATVSPEEQGLFFSFLSITALQSIFDAGITSIFVNFCAHEKVRFHSSETERNDAREKLISIATAARRWFLIIASLFALLAGVGGFFYLRTSLGGNFDLGHWPLAYAILILAVGILLSNLSRIALLEGWGHIGDVARIRFRANLTSTAMLWLILFMGFGVWALSLSYLTQALVIVWGTTRLSKSLPIQFPILTSKQPLERKINWKQDIFPLQMRMGISYFCGYLVSQAVVPFSLKYYGPVEAGKIGLANSIFSAATTVLASLIYLSGPKYAEHIVQRNWHHLNKMFFRTTLFSLFSGIVGFSGILVVLITLSKHLDIFSNRVPEINILVALGIIGMANLYVGSAATLMRAFKQEPMLPISILAAALYVTAMYFTSRLNPTIFFYLITAGQVLIIVPSTMLVKHYFLERHAST